MKGVAANPESVGNEDGSNKHQGDRSKGELGVDVEKDDEQR